MVFTVAAMFAIIAFAFVCRYYAARTRLAEKEIDKVIARRLAASDYVTQVVRLREENTVMRNILLDLIENENTSQIASKNFSNADIARLKTNKIRRYREILAESAHVLQSHDHDTNSYPARMDASRP